MEDLPLLSGAACGGLTHVVCRTDHQHAARRTVKYLMGIVRGCWVLDMGWAKACLDARGPVSEESYVVRGLCVGGNPGSGVWGKMGLGGEECKRC